MNQGSVARRYATALLGLAVEAGHPEQVGGELADFARTLAAEPTVSGVLTHPGFTKAERKELLSSLLARSGYAPVTRDFLLLLVDKSRIDQYAAIAREYARGLDEALGRLRATVRTATPLEAAVHERLRIELCRVTGKQVILTAHIDPSLIGGMVTEVGGRVYDGSIRTRLEALRGRLSAGPVGSA